MPLTDQSIKILEETSRTFFVPVIRLPDGLRDAVGCAYLCMRAIDEIEDHQSLSKGDKIALLRSISQLMQSANHALNLEAFGKLFSPHKHSLPEVTRRVGEFAMMAPDDMAHRIWDATSTMADRMADWVACDWTIETEGDLDSYTYCVAGAVGLLLSDLWSWHDGVRSNRANAVGFGRGLQAVNILRNRLEDQHRGVDFYPNGWNDDDMIRYIDHQLSLGDAYINELPSGPANEFCQIPLALAHATVEVIRDGGNKLTRDDVLRIVSDLGLDSA